MKVALIKTGALGDVVRTTSIVTGLRRTFGDVAVTWITSRAAVPLVSGLRGVRPVAIDDSRDARWRAARYDWIISLDDDRAGCETATALDAARLSGAYVDGSGASTYTSDVDAWFGMGILRPSAIGGLAAANDRKRANTDTCGELLYRALGLDLPVAPPTVIIPRQARARANAWLTGHGLALESRQPRPIGLATGAAGRWRFKSWRIEATTALARSLAEEGRDVIVLGGRAEAARNAAICAGAAHERVVAGPDDFDLLSFAALVAQCAALVCSDSLAMHLAIAADVPVTALFGPTSDAEIDLFGRGEKIVAPVPCARCYLPTCEVTPNCMETITPEMVRARLAPLLQPLDPAAAAHRATERQGCWSV